MASEWIDITVSIRNGMPYWPDNPPPRIERMMDLERGDDATVSTLVVGSHTGTHMDAPLHFIEGGQGLEDMPLTATIGECRVIDINHPEIITVDELKKHRIASGERVLFKTNNSAQGWPDRKFLTQFVYLSTEAARWLVAQRVWTIGVDYLSIGGYEKNGPEVHRVLLEAGVWIIEGLDLSRVQAGRYDLICLPLKFDHSDGAPARAVIRPRLTRRGNHDPATRHLRRVG
jgi:arylformamidase